MSAVNNISARIVIPATSVLITSAPVGTVVTAALLSAQNVVSIATTATIISVLTANPVWSVQRITVGVANVITVVIA